MCSLVGELVVQTLCAMTGHVLLRWWSRDRWNTSQGTDEMEAIVGLMFWVAVGVSVWFIFFR